MNKTFFPIIKAAACAILTAAILLAPSCKRGSKKAAEEPVATEQAAEDLDAQYAKDLLAKGTPAPGFTLRTPDDKEVSLSDFLGSEHGSSIAVPTLSASASARHCGVPGVLLMT